MPNFIVPEQTAPDEVVVNPDTGETEYVIEHYRQGDHRYRIVNDLRTTVVDEDGNQAPVRTWTPLAIKRACGERWPAVKAALEAAGIYEDFVMAQELLENDPAFMQGVAWARQEYGDAAVDAVLDDAEIERMRDLDAAELQRRGL